MLAHCFHASGCTCKFVLRCKNIYTIGPWSLQLGLTSLVFIQDENDKTPVITATLTEIDVDENSSGLIPDISIFASDADADIDNARFDVTLE